MERIPVRDCADGQRRADQGALLQASPVTGLAISPKVAAYTVINAETGCGFSTEGATVTVTFTLPTPLGAGEHFTFIKMTAFDVVVGPPSNVTLNGSASALSNTTAGDTTGIGVLTVVSISATKYVVASKTGTWA